jgi:hypothetical protein
MNVSIEEVEAKLLEKKIDQIKVQEIVKELEEVVQELKEERAAEKGPKQKWEYVIVLNDDEGLLTGKEIAGWVVQQKEGEDAGAVVAKLCDAARSQNEAAKRKKNTITGLVGLFESLKSKFAKEKNIRVKTKDLTRVLITDGKMI